MILTSESEAASKLGLLHKYQFSKNKSAPLVFLVHGRAGNCDVMWTFRRCIPEEFSIIAPQAPISDPIGGHSWWPVTEGYSKHQAINAQELLMNFIISSVDFYMLEPRLIIALGFSQGGALLSMLSQSNPASFSGIAILAGFVIKMDSVINTLHKPQIFMAHGLNDEVVPLTKSTDGKLYLEQNGYNVTYVTDNVSHKIGIQGMKSLKEWIVKI
ncbi:MAG: hypothetical protein SGJ02_02250 [bacterium]|nr:hypothetical protein [bacterium]